MLGAIAMMVLASFVIVGIMVNSATSQDAARGQLASTSTEQLARDAGTMLAASYSSLSSGEYDGFVPRQERLQQHASTLAGGAVIPNAAAMAVDHDRIPAYGRFTVRQDLQDGRRGYWQLFSMRLPNWGTTKGGRTVAFVRAWTDGGSDASLTQPVIYRVEFRPTWFADYQMLFDGPLSVLNGATITGRVHSNGYRESFFDQFATLGSQIKIVGTTCAPSARISTASGSINASGACGAAPVANPGTGTRINLLRARDLAQRLREVCALPASARPAVSIRCLSGAGETNVVLAGNAITFSGPGGAGSLAAGVVGDRPSQNQGAVLVVGGNVNLSGTLDASARALVVAATPSGAAAYGSGGAPSAWIRNAGSVGSDPSESGRSSFGLVVEGDIIFDESTACPIAARGAFTSISGLMSVHPTWRVPIVIGGGTPCGSTARIHGSIVGHYAPVMTQPANNAGYAQRSYEMLDSLYHNPPPLYPTAADWQVTKFAPANLDCFTKVGGGYSLAAACV